jgi:hypothetical protein
MRDKVTLFGKPYTPNMATQWAAMCAEEFQAAQKDEVWWTRLKDVFDQIPGDEPDFVKFVRLYWVHKHKRDDPSRSLGSFLSRQSYCEREDSEVKGREIVIAAMHLLANKGFFIPNGLSFQKNIYQYIYNLDRDDGFIRGIDVCVVEYAEIQRKEQERKARFQDRRVEATASAKVYRGEGASPTTRR